MMGLLMLVDGPFSFGRDQVVLAILRSHRLDTFAFGSEFCFSCFCRYFLRWTALWLYVLLYCSITSNCWQRVGVASPNAVINTCEL